jgi:hypothetical protein
MTKNVKTLQTKKKNLNKKIFFNQESAINKFIPTPPQEKAFPARPALESNTLLHFLCVIFAHLGPSS